LEKWGIQQREGGKVPRDGGNGCGIGCMVFILTVVVVSIIGGLSSCGKTPSTNSNNTRFEAVAQCEARVSSMLKAPSTAKFDSQARSSATSTSAWAVTGTVDSENSFGAMLRSNFSCTVAIHGESATVSVDSFR
jgi:hypothetical protein